jgi:hypothetical protein
VSADGGTVVVVVVVVVGVVVVVIVVVVEALDVAVVAGATEVAEVNGEESVEVHAAAATAMTAKRTADWWSLTEGTVPVAALLIVDTLGRVVVPVYRRWDEHPPLRGSVRARGCVAWHVSFRAASPRRSSVPACASVVRLTPRGSRRRGDSVAAT